MFFLRKPIFILTKAAFIWSKYSKNSNFVKYYYNFKITFLFIYFKL